MRRRRVPDVATAIEDVLERLRSGASLRQAIVASAAGSPFTPIASALSSGRPLADVLREGATTSADAHLRSALCVLSAHAGAGGDPVPAVSALASRMRRLEAARREARALTTQARLGARAMLLLTPGFWLLLLAADPRGTRESLADPHVRVATALGVLLQVVGALWIGAIVGRVAGKPSRLGRLPVVRALWALATGRARSSVADDVAHAADALAFVLEAGFAPSTAIETVAPVASGVFGDRLRVAAVRVRAGLRLSDAMRDATDDLGDPARRLTAAFDSSVLLGVPLAPRLRSLADEIRERSAAQLSEDVRGATIRVLVPLGLLILPAFVLSCLVPLLAGGLSGIRG